MAGPHTPTQQQLNNLAALKATAATASTTLSTAQASLATAKASYVAAQAAVDQYEAYIYGAAPVGAIDIGSQNA